MANISSINGNPIVPSNGSVGTAQVASGYNLMTDAEKSKLSGVPAQGDTPFSSINGNPIVVGTSGLSDGAITEQKMAASAVSTDKLADGAVTLAKIAEGVIGSGADAISEDTRNMVGPPYADGTEKYNWGITYKVQDDGAITIDGTSSGGTSGFLLGTYEVEAGETYTLSVGGTTTVVYTIVRDLEQSGEQLVRIYGSGSGTFVAPESGVVWVRIYIYPSRTEDNSTHLVCIEKGSTAHNFIPHVSAADYVVRERVTAIESHDVVQDAAIDALRESIGSGHAATSNDAYLYRDKVPSYYIAQPDYPQGFDDDDYLETKIKQVPDGPSFMFFTDTHWESNMKNTVPIMQYVRKRLGIDKVVFGGDAINRESSRFSGTTLLAEGRHMAKKVMADFAYQCRAAFGGSFLAAVGNHDVNLVDANEYSDGDWQKGHIMLPFSQVREVLQGDLPSSVVREDVYDRLQDYASGETLEELNEYFLTNFYVDDDVSKIRFIVLNSGNPGYKSVNADAGVLMNPVADVFDISQARELILHMDFAYHAMLGTPAGYHVVLCAHSGMGDVSRPSSPSAELGWYGLIYAQMMSALKTKSSATVNPHVTASDSENLKSWVGTGNKTYSFESANDVGAALIIRGHVHYDAMLYARVGSSSMAGYPYDGTEVLDQSNGDVPVVITTTDAVNRWQDGYDEYEVPMQAGTTTDQAFDVVTFTDDGIVITRFGAGNDRHIYLS